MTKARDLADIAGAVSGGKIATSDIPDLDAAKITSGTVNNARITLDAAEIPNLDTSKITTGTFADARVSASSVTQHSAPTDLQPIKSDISALALREATNESSAAFNLPNQFIDTFATDTLGTKTNIVVSSGYLSSGEPSTTPSATTNLLLHFNNNTNDSSGNSANPTGSGGTITYDASDKKFGSHAAYFDGNDYITFNQGDGGTWFGSGDWAIDFWCKPNSSSNNTNYRAFYGHQGQDSSNYHQLNFLLATPYLHSYNDVLDSTSQPLTLAAWNHVLVQRYNNTLKFWVNGNLCNPSSGLSLSKNFNTTNDFGIGYDGMNAKYTGMYDEFRICKHAPTVTTGDALYIGNDTGNFTPPTAAYTLGSLSATGTAIQAANTVGSAKTKVGGTMLYKDNAGTATLGTDLKIYFTCNGGTNWTEASSYSAITPVYSSGIKQVRLGETTCTSGTDIRYKAVWANQASGSKETQLHGIGINY